METLTKKDLDPIRQAVEALTLSAKRIETALLGDADMHVEGIASKVHRHEAHIEKSKTRVGWITGVSTGLGFLLHHLFEKFKNLFE